MTLLSNPKGCKESSRWSESAETTGKSLVMDRTPKGCQTSGQRKRDLYSERSGTPPGCDPINLAFPVVSADSDHRLLSWQPFGLLRRVNYIVSLPKGSKSIFNLTLIRGSFSLSLIVRKESFRTQTTNFSVCVSLLDRSVSSFTH